MFWDNLYGREAIAGTLNTLRQAKPLWRGSLLPLDCAAVPIQPPSNHLTHRARRFWGRFAAQREQAPSPQGIAVVLQPFTKPVDRSHTQQRNASRDALRHRCANLRPLRYAERPRRHSHAERGNDRSTLNTLRQAHPCGEQACPALGCEAALKPEDAFCLNKRGSLIGAAAQPNAGQACSPQQNLSGSHPTFHKTFIKPPPGSHVQVIALTPPAPTVV